MRTTKRGLLLIFLCSAIASLSLAGAVAAPLDIPGFVFPPTAGADVATIVAGSDPSFYLCGATSDDGAPTLPGLTVEESAKRVFTDGTADAELLGRAVVDIAFVDNIVVNRSGPDLIVFESGQPEALAVVVVDPVTRVFTAAPHFYSRSDGVGRRLWVPAERCSDRSD